MTPKQQVKPDPSPSGLVMGIYRATQATGILHRLGYSYEELFRNKRVGIQEDQDFAVC
jgi:hypothetical protein